MRGERGIFVKEGKTDRINRRSRGENEGKGVTEGRGL